MAKPIVLPQPMEGIVRFIEETEPERIVEATLARLAEDRDPRALFAASAIAVSR